MNPIQCSFILFAHIFILSYCQYRISEAHTFNKTYAEKAIANGFWKLLGNASITNGDVVLTEDMKSQSGGIWSLKPVDFPEWVVEIEFQVYSDPQKKSDNFADGLVLWYADSPVTLGKGDVYGYKNTFKGFGIFLDTFNNDHETQQHKYPYVYLIAHYGSVYFDNDHAGANTQEISCVFEFRSSKLTAFIKLQHKNDTLTLWKRRSDENYTKCFSTVINNLPTNCSFGVTASTGYFSDLHKLISFHLIDLTEEKDRIIKNYRASIKVIGLVEFILLILALIHIDVISMKWVTFDVDQYKTWIAYNYVVPICTTLTALVVTEQLLFKDITVHPDNKLRMGFKLSAALSLLAIGIFAVASCRYSKKTRFNFIIEAVICFSLSIFYTIETALQSGIKSLA
ncbi:hypothetical protein GJ496_002634 [Pomphorhynchus laevis]|nr:hypothetical protein GJ496_002634 [Pomphorhynchus laevis]